MLKVNPNPTFHAPVEIPTPDGPVKIKCEFKHMDKEQYQEFIKAESTSKRSDEEAIMDIMVSWSGVDKEFSKDALRDVCKNYHKAATAIVEAFINTLTQAAAKN